MNTETTGPQTLIEAVRYFADPDAATKFFAKMRWGGEVHCPHCGSVAVSYLKNQRRWQCREKHARKQFSAKVGTIFEDSALGMDKWLVAIWSITNDKNGISSCELALALGITQKSTWFMLHRVRHAMKSGTFEKMGLQRKGTESDETFIGGLYRNMHRSKRAKMIGTGGANKTPVMGLLERHSEKGKSKVRTFVVPNVQGETLHAVIHKNVAPGTAVYTDAASGYRGLSADYYHRFVDHAETYVRGAVHTNGLENFWSLFKRALKGTYVSCDVPHLHRYLDEQAFRFNERKMTDAERFAKVMPGVIGKRLTYKTLIGVLEGHFPSGEAATDDRLN